MQRIRYSEPVRQTSCTNTIHMFWCFAAAAIAQEELARQKTMSHLRHDLDTFRTRLGLCFRGVPGEQGWSMIFRHDSNVFWILFS